MSGSDPRKPVPVEELGEARWDRLERRLFEARDRELAAGVAEGARAVEERAGGWRPRRRQRWMPFAVVGAAVAAAVAVQLVMRPRSPGEFGAGASTSGAEKPTRVVTPAGGSTRLEIGDAVILVGAETTAEIQQGTEGAIRVALAKGLVDCEVAPRGPRPPFEVLAGDVTVTVVGTKFQVERQADVKVTVARGKVSVRSPSGERQVAAGESWASGVVTAVATPVPGAQPGAGTGAVAGAGTAAGTGAAAGTAAGTGTGAGAGTGAVAGASGDQDHAIKADGVSTSQWEKELDRADELSATAPDQALVLYRRLGRAPNRKVAARAVYSIAFHENRLENHEAAIKAADEYERRFPNGRNLADAAWERVLGYYYLSDPRRREAARRYLEIAPDDDDPKRREKARQIANW